MKNWQFCVWATVGLLGGGNVYWAHAAEDTAVTAEEIPSELVIDGKTVVREDFDLTHPLELAQVGGFYCYSTTDAQQTGVVGTWSISEQGQLKVDETWNTFNFTHIWDFRIADNGKYTMSWVIYRGDPDADPFDIQAMDLWRRIEGCWRVGWRSVTDNTAYPVVISIFERSQIWRADDVGQAAPSHDQELSSVWVMKYSADGHILEFAVPQVNGPDLTFEVCALDVLGGSGLPSDFLIEHGDATETEFTIVTELSWGQIKQ